MEGIRVVVVGAGGKMGREVIRGIWQSEGLELVGAVDITNTGEDIGLIIKNSGAGILISDNLAETLRQTGAEVMVDFTHPGAVAANLRTAIALGVPAVVGTTGLSAAEREEFHQLSLERGVGVLIAPNFAIGVVLLLQFAEQAGRFFPAVEIIERHHAEKADAPSGTALQIADCIAKGRVQPLPRDNRLGTEKIPGVRGGAAAGTPIHSLRLPGSIAHHEVIFGGLGQSLTLKHDSMSRESFIPGVLLAIRQVRQLKGVLFGLEGILNLTNR